MIGVRMDQEKVDAALRECLLTDEEARLPPAEWDSAWNDPFKEGWDALLDAAAAEAHEHDHTHSHDHGHDGHCGDEDCDGHEHCGDEHCDNPGHHH